MTKAKLHFTIHRSTIPKRVFKKEQSKYVPADGHIIKICGICRMYCYIFIKPRYNIISINMFESGVHYAM